MPLPKFVDNTVDLTIQEYTNVPSFGACASLATSFATANGWTNSSGVLTTDVSTSSVRNDMDLDSEYAAIKFDTTSGEIEVGGADSGGSILGISMTQALDHLFSNTATTPAGLEHEYLFNTGSGVGTDGVGTIDLLGTAGNEPATTTGLDAAFNEVLRVDTTESRNNTTYTQATLLPDSATDWTIDFYFRTTDNFAANIVRIRNSGSTVIANLATTSSGNFDMDINDNGGTTITTATSTGGALTNDTWHHMMVAYNATNDTFKLYINGVQDGTSGAVGGIPTYSGPLQMVLEPPSGGLDIHRFESYRVWTVEKDLAYAEARTNALNGGPESGTLGDQTVTFWTDGDGSNSGSFLAFDIRDNGASNGHFFYAGLANREREQYNLQLVDPLPIDPGGGNVVTATVPQDSDSNRFFPKMYNPVEANYRGDVKIFGEDGTIETVTITAVTYSALATTAEVTIEGNASAHTIGSLIGVNPKPVILTRGFRGQTIETGAVESFDLFLHGEKKDSSGAASPPGTDEDIDLVSLAYSTSEAHVAGRVFALAGASTQRIIADGGEINFWREINGRSENMVKTYGILQMNDVPLSGGGPTYSWLMEDTGTPISQVSELADAVNLTTIVASGIDPQRLASGLTGFGNEWAIDFPTGTKASTNAQLPATVLGQDFSWVLWFNVDNITGAKTFVEIYDTNGSPPPTPQHMRIGLSGSTLQFFLTNTSDSSVAAVAGPVTASTWHMVSVTYTDGADITIRTGEAGGTLSARPAPTAFTTARPVNSFSQLNFGDNNGGTENMNGLLHVGYFFDYAITEADEVSLFQEGAPVYEDISGPTAFSVIHKTDYA